MVDIQSATTDVRREKKKEEKEINHRAKIKWPALFHTAAIIRHYSKTTPTPA